MMEVEATGFSIYLNGLAKKNIAITDAQGCTTGWVEGSTGLSLHCLRGVWVEMLGREFCSERKFAIHVTVNFKIFSETTIQIRLPLEVIQERA